MTDKYLLAKEEYAKVGVDTDTAIARIKEILMKNGALGALMSGSGPTVFALFDDRKQAELALERLRGTKLAAQSYLTTFTDHTCVG